MIENDLEFQVTLTQLDRLLRGLDDLRNTVLAQNPKLFATLSEGVLDDIERLRLELERYGSGEKVAG